MKLLQIAITQIGVTEDAAHTNHGEAIKYQDAVGLPKGGGFPWCQSLVFWCGQQAYGPLNPVPKTGRVLEAWRQAKAKGLPVIEKAAATPENILPGYQFILDFGGGLGHTGIVESVDPDGTMHTIEGNANPEGGRDGYAVARLSKRKLTDGKLLGFICYKDLEEVTA